MRGGVQYKTGKNSRAKECDARQGFILSKVVKEDARIRSSALS